MEATENTAEERRFDSKIKALVVAKGYNSVSHFSKEEEVSYYLLRRLMHGTANSLDVPFLVDVCKKLDCEIGDLIILNKEEIKNEKK